MFVMHNRYLSVSFNAKRREHNRPGEGLQQITMPWELLLLLLFMMMKAWAVQTALDTVIVGVGTFQSRLMRHTCSMSRRINCLRRRYWSRAP